MVRSLKKVFRVLCSAMAGIVSRVVPRSDSIWVVGGNKGLRFADNSMYFFKYCCHATPRQVVWLTHSREILKQVRSEGYRAFLSYSLLGLYYGFRSKWHVFDVGVNDTSLFSSVGALHFNMWHGYPIKDHRFLKSIGLKVRPSLVRRVWRAIRNWPVGNSHYYMLHQNKLTRWYITDSFDVRTENVLVANYPRNIVFDDAVESSRYISRLALSAIKDLDELRNAGQRIVGYFPTWRGNGTDSFLGTLDTAKLEEFNAFLVENKLTVVTKWHSCVYKAYQHVGECSDAENLLDVLEAQSNVYVLGFEQDLNSTLNCCDLLISDYSGVIVDYLLSDKPQIIVPYDLDEYERDWGFLVDFENFNPGPRAENIEKLLPLLREFAGDPESFSSQSADCRAALREEIFDELAGASKIVEFLEDISGSSK